MNRDLHYLQVAVWVFRGVGCEFNQCVHSGRNNIQRSQGEPAPDRTTRYGDHLEGGDNAEVVPSALENAEQVYGESVTVFFEYSKVKGRRLAEKSYESRRLRQTYRYARPLNPL